jgi:hypothetical protein
MANAMTLPFAYAQRRDDPLESVVLVLCGALLIGVMLVLAVIPSAIVRGRRARHPQNILAIGVVWGVVAAASVAYPAIRRANWNKEHNLQIQTGYYDPQDVHDRPNWPWKTWGGVAVAYGALLGWSLMSRKPTNSAH